MFSNPDSFWNCLSWFFLFFQSCLLEWWSDCVFPKRPSPPLSSISRYASLLLSVLQALWKIPLKTTVLSVISHIARTIISNIHSERSLPFETQARAALLMSLCPPSGKRGHSSSWQYNFTVCDSWEMSLLFGHIVILLLQYSMVSLNIVRKSLSVSPRNMVVPATAKCKKQIYNKPSTLQRTSKVSEQFLKVVDDILMIFK